MTTTSDLANAIGRKQISDALGVGLTAVSNAVVRGWFPPSWFLAVKELADAKGADCPPDLFKMKAPVPRSVDRKRQRQESIDEKARGRVV